MQLGEFDYQLPASLIAQRPLERRDASRLLVLDRLRESWEDRQFRELPELLSGDELLVVNNARVIPARLIARRVRRPGRWGAEKREFFGAPIEVLLTRQMEPRFWEALVRPGRKVRIGERLVFGEGFEAEVVERGAFGLRRLRFTAGGDFDAQITRLGHVPLPPYIDRSDEPVDWERYQTIFASHAGAVAAPTAGLHFTEEVCARLRARGIKMCELTLNVGLGTFQPIRQEEIENHSMATEWCEIPASTAKQIAAAQHSRRPIVAVGTTVVRALEDSAQKGAARALSRSREGHDSGPVLPGKSEADIFIYPGFKFRVVEQLLTNFHLPRSSLLVLVAAFAGRDFLLEAYQHAIAEKYRFYSYGDCMLIR